MRRDTVFVTGTDTGVGKTVLTALLARYLRENGISVLALKPVCSGGREDARTLQAALNGAFGLDEINPWYFRAPVAPSVAARREHKQIRLAEMLAYLRATQERFDVLLIEGAGGLLSPLGEDFNSRDLITALRATPVVVGSNRLGVVNQVLLTLEALPARAWARAHVVLMSLPRPDASSGSNPDLLAGHFDEKRIFLFPWLGARCAPAKGLKNSRAREAVKALASSFQNFL